MSITETPTTPATLLEAINTLLRAVRLGKLDSLAQTVNNEAAAGAKAALDDVARETQLEGWEWNTDLAWDQTPDVDGIITLPPNVLKATVSNTWAGDYPVWREGKLWNRNTHTFTGWTEAVPMDIVTAIEFADMPPAARAYVTAVAARRFGLPKSPSPATFQFTEEMVKTARATMEAHDIDMRGGQNLSTLNPHFVAMRRGKKAPR